MEKAYNQSAIVNDFRALTKKILGVEMSVTRDTMIRWIKCGHIRPTQIMPFGKATIRLFSEASVEEFIRSIPELEKQLVLRVRRVKKNVKASKKHRSGPKQWDQYETADKTSNRK